MTKSRRRAARLAAGVGAFIILGTGLARAEPRDYFGLTITEVRYEGVKTVDTALVRRVSGFETGAVLNAGVTQEAIRQLYALSLFSDIQIEAERAAPGVRVTIRVTEYPRLRSVVWHGNKKLKQNNLRDRIVPDVLESQE